jgi:hypothetical protein
MAAQGLGRALRSRAARCLAAPAPRSEDRRAPAGSSLRRRDRSAHPRGGRGRLRGSGHGPRSSTTSSCHRGALPADGSTTASGSSRMFRLATASTWPPISTSSASLPSRGAHVESARLLKPRRSQEHRHMSFDPRRGLRSPAPVHADLEEEPHLASSGAAAAQSYVAKADEVRAQEERDPVAGAEGRCESSGSAKLLSSQTTGSSERRADLAAARSR